MIVSDIDIFLSCSFASDDAAVNELVRSICAGIGMACVNVGAGFTAVPPEKAKEYISNAAGLIAVATKRDRLDSGEYIMPSAVREEISIAYGLGKPILVIGEEGVRFDGFMNNYGTRLPFSRDNLMSPSFIENLVLSIFTFRQEVVAIRADLYQYAGEYFSESTRRLVSLDYDGSAYWWTVSLTKRLRFEAALQRDIATSVWPAVPSSQVRPGAPPAQWSVTIDNSSRPFEIQPAVRVIAPDRVDLSLHFQPEPQSGDYIEFTRVFKSQYLNPLFADDLPEGAPPAVIINGRKYAISDGVVLAERTKKLHSHYAFPTAYGLRPDDIAVFVASHTFRIDYLAPWELKRVAADVELFGTKLIVDLRVEEPMLRHMYGIAFTPPSRADEVKA